MFTQQEYIYLALGQRRLAQDALKDAETQPALATKEAFLSAAKAYGELAQKCERLASEAARSSPAAQPPSTSAAPPGRPGALPSYRPSQTGVVPSSHAPVLVRSRTPRR